MGCASSQDFLFLAVVNQDINRAKIILKHHSNIDVNISRKHWKSSLHPSLVEIAIRNGDRPMLDLLLSQSKLNFDMDHQDSALLLAVCNTTASKSEVLDIVQLLIKRFPSIHINRKDKNGVSLLEHAAASGHDRVVQLFLKHENIKVFDEKGICKVLITAAEHGDMVIMKMLFDYPGINCFNMANGGVDALMAAVEGGHVEIIHMMMKNNKFEVTSADLGDVVGRIKDAYISDNQLSHKILDAAAVLEDMYYRPNIRVLDSDELRQYLVRESYFNIAIELYRLGFDGKMAYEITNDELQTELPSLTFTERKKFLALITESKLKYHSFQSSDGIIVRTSSNAEPILTRTSSRAASISRKASIDAEY